MSLTLEKLNSNNHNSSPAKMRVQKRNGRGYEQVKFDKITERIRYLCVGLSPLLDPIKIALQTIKNLYDGITTEELDIISAKIAESFKLIHPDYSLLAAKILISNLHKTTPKKFSECMAVIAKQTNIASVEHYDFIHKHASILDNMIIDSNDYLFDYFGYKTLEKSYLAKVPEDVLDENGKPVYTDNEDNRIKDNIYFRGPRALAKINGRVVSLLRKTTMRVMDRPQYMFMRVAIAIYKDSAEKNATMLENIKNCYKALSQMYFTHATPTLFNSCSKVQQLNSCFMMGTGDSIEGIMKTLSDCAMISKWAGGIGVHMHEIRSKGSRIKGTNGESSGLTKQLKMYNEVARTFDQGGKRLGAFAIYLEPWHGDILEFLKLKLQQGADTERARDLFYALWVPDLFIARVETDGDWSLFSPHSAPGLSDVYDGMDVCSICGHCENVDYNKHKELLDEILKERIGIDSNVQNCTHYYTSCDVFTWLYTKYEEDGMAVKTISARTVMDAICELQRESGVPYICFKDHVNRQSNQSNIGTIKSSNLCTEISEWSSDSSYACCTLASINLKKFLIMKDGRQQVDLEKLHEIVRMITRNLDIIITVNKYPVDECEDNSRKYRPIGIGIQALADLFAAKRISYLSNEAREDDLAITETIYHAALTESCARAKELGPYEGFAGSPASKGLLAFDLWRQNQFRIGSSLAVSLRYDWDILRKDIQRDGLRNSLLVAFMPTVSTSQIMGNNESFEPFASNLYTKNTLAGKFTITNNAMIRHLMELGLWNENIKNKIIAADGSVAGIEEIPADVREIYKTVWEMKQTELMERSALRGAFIDQAESFNVYLRDNSNSVLRGVMLKGHKLGKKTGSYYIRTQPAAKALKNNADVIGMQMADRKTKQQVTGTTQVITPIVSNMVAMDNTEITEITGADDEGDAPVCPIGCTTCSS